MREHDGKAVTREYDTVSGHGSPVHDRNGIVRHTIDGDQYCPCARCENIRSVDCVEARIGWRNAGCPQPGSIDSDDVESVALTSQVCCARKVEREEMRIDL